MSAASGPSKKPEQEEQEASPPPAILRFVHINDCYELANLPRLATAIREVSSVFCACRSS